MAAFNIYQLFSDAAHRSKNTTVLVQDDASVTYGDLELQIRETAAYYLHIGLAKGDRVLVFVPMSIELYRIVLALFYIGAVPVFLDEWVSLKRLRICCELVPCRGIIAGRSLLFMSVFIRELRQIPLKILPSKRADAANMPGTADTHRADTALITFTTGTRGLPKAADRTHEFLHAQYHTLQPIIDTGCHTSLVTLPIVTLLNLGLCKTTVLPARSFRSKRPGTANLLTDDIVRNGVSEIICSPAILQRICKHISKRNIATSQVSRVITGGGAVFPDLAALVRHTFSAARSTVVYGSTESEPVSHIDMEHLAGITWQQVLASGLCVGTPDKAAKVAIIKWTDAPVMSTTTHDFEKMHLPSGEVGEIVVTGAHVLKAYINNEPARQRNKILVDGHVWHRTGDAGSMDATGQLHFWGLCKEIIHSNERTYYPVICCYAFRMMTGVAQCALLLHKGKLTLAIQSAQVKPAGLLTGVLEALALSSAAIVYVEKIPVDPRHHTKVDYDKLSSLLNRRSSAW